MLMFAIEEQKCWGLALGMFQWSLIVAVLWFLSHKGMTALSFPVLGMTM